MEQVKQLFESVYGKNPDEIDKIKGAGSNRTYYRLKDNGKSIIGMVGTSVRENQAFIYMSRHFIEKGISVPHIIAVSDDNLCYLQEDLGTMSLFDLISNGRKTGTFSEEEIKLLRKTISQLPKIQFEGAKEFDFSKCYPQSEMDMTNVMFDLNYFKYCFLKLKGIEFDEYLLESDFKALASDLLSESSETFMYRDFQSRNVMIKDNEPYFIDFQGGRKGSFYYDVASFLWQASAHFTDELRNSLIELYYEKLTMYSKVEKSHFIDRLYLFVLFRTLQVLGAYGFRGLWEKKQHFIESIPSALLNLSEFINKGVSDKYTYLKIVLKELVKIQIVENKESKDSKVAALISADKTYKTESSKPLVVRVFSFSFKKGIPADSTGNGGGYVFDCRATHNPGRYEQYKSFTGLDKCVIDFLEEDGEILTFLESVYKLADFHVARFMERGFTDLMFSCGCTGGRHRSVYSAQHLAEHINNKFGIEVRIEHREQNINSVLPSKIL